MEVLLYYYVCNLVKSYGYLNKLKKLIWFSHLLGQII